MVRIAMRELAEEMLSLISKKGKIEIREIQEKLCLTRETATTIVDFLLEFGFVWLDESKTYVRLSEPCRKLLEEETNHEQDNNGHALAVVCMW